MNNVQLHGRLTKDPEVKTTSTGKKVASFTVAASNKFGKTEFIECQAWDKTAELLESDFYKGKEICVDDASLIVSRWDDKDGNHRSKMLVNVNHFDYCGSKNENSDNAQVSSVKEEPKGELNFIPFTGSENGSAIPEDNNFEILSDDDADDFVPF